MSLDIPGNEDMKEYHRKYYRDKKDYFQNYYHEHKEHIISRSIEWNRKFKETNNELYRLKNATIYYRNRDKVLRKKREAYRLKMMHNLREAKCIVGCQFNVTLAFD